MIKHQKIRGHKRRQKTIEQWELANLDRRFDFGGRYQYAYVKILVRPWCDKSMTNSGFPEPKGKTKRLILSGLVNIYHSWKKQLDQLGQPYYLKIWLYEPRFSKSQVVCAVGDKINYYNNLFFNPAEKKQLRFNNYDTLKSNLAGLNWEYRLDKDHIESDYVGEPGLYLTNNDFLETKKWFNKTMKKPHRTTELDNSMQYYSLKKGEVWLGGD